jgi:hypothetical protein
MTAPHSDDREEAPWFEYRRLVLTELDRLHDGQSALSVKIDTLRLDMQTRLSLIREEDISKVRVDVAMLKIKSGLWGGLAGLIPAILALLYFVLSAKK